MYSDLKSMAGSEEGLQIQVLDLRARKNDLEAQLADLQDALQ